MSSEAPKERSHDLSQQGSDPLARLPTVRELFDAHASRVHRTLRFLGVPPADLPDAVQDVFMVVHRKLPEFERRSSIETWLFGIATRVASGRLRSASNAREEVVAEVPEGAVEPSQHDQLERQRARAHLVQALKALDEPKRAVFVLFEIEERSMAEVATIVGCPLRTAYARLEAARREVISGWRRVSNEGAGP